MIPAHNEENVIERCISAILDTARADEFQIVVACNGCSDATAQVARESFPQVTVLESEVASKTAALNLADSFADIFPRIYLDADLVVPAEALRALIEPLESGDALASAGNMQVLHRHSSWLVSSFYKVWSLNPYLDNGKFGGVFAVSKAGHQRIGSFPAVTNDDELVKRSFSADERATVDSCVFEMRAPQNLAGLLKIRTRAIRGTLELNDASLNGAGYAAPGAPAEEGASSFLLIVRRVIFRPRLWLNFVAYTMISVWVRIKAGISFRRGEKLWERDETSRQAA